MAENTAELEARIWESLADAGAAIEALPYDERLTAVDDAFDELFPTENDRRGFIMGVLVVAHERRLADRARREAEAEAVQP